MRSVRQDAIQGRHIIRQPTTGFIKTYVLWANDFI